MKRGRGEKGCLPKHKFRSALYIPGEYVPPRQHLRPARDSGHRPRSQEHDVEGSMGVCVPR